jgi:hypothetical protein
MPTEYGLMQGSELSMLGFRVQGNHACFAAQAKQLLFNNIKILFFHFVLGLGF